MTKAVVILGAGASKGLGLPLLSKVFADPEVRSYLEKDATELAEFLRNFIWEPRGLTIDSSDRTLNIEEILTLLRTWQQTGSKLLRVEQIRALQRELLGCVYHGVWPHKGQTSTDKRYLNSLVKWADEKFDEVTWATFNWDAKLEQAFYHQVVIRPKTRCALSTAENRPTGLGWRKPQAQPSKASWKRDVASQAGWNPRLAVG